MVPLISKPLNILFITNIAEELLIDFRELIGEHSGENMAEVVWDSLKRYGLESRVSLKCHYTYSSLIP